MHGLDATVPSLIVHVGLYLSSVAAPFPFIRFPGWLGPRLYMVSACYQTVASSLMLLVAFSLEDGRDLPQPELWALLSAATGMTLVGAGLMATFVRREYRHTFYKVGKNLRGKHRITATQYCYQRFTTLPYAHEPTHLQHKSLKSLLTWAWLERTECSYGDGTNASRANVLNFATWAWPASDQVRGWLENWEQWERDPPEW